jgi:hypothetical protein
MKLYLIPAAVAVLATYAVFSGLASVRASHQCDNGAADWLTFANSQGMQDPTKQNFYATEFAKLSVACPNGNVLVDVSAIPASIQQLAMRPDIMQVALQKIEEKKNR